MKGTGDTMARWLGSVEQKVNGPFLRSDLKLKELVDKLKSFFEGNDRSIPAAKGSEGPIVTGANCCALNSGSLSKANIVLRARDEYSRSSPAPICFH